jgi:WD40 repeat protein
MALLVGGLAALAAAPLTAQPVAPEPHAPGSNGPAATAADVKELRDKYRIERAQAVKADFPADLLAKPDELVKRADEAAAAKNYKAAARHLRDARWQLPYLPPGLPEHVTRVLGESRMRQADRINALAYSPDGRHLASASADYTVKVWDLGTGREVTTYRGHLDQPDDPTKAGNPLGTTDVAFHPTDPVIASCSGNQVHLWNPTTGKPVKTVLDLGKTADKPIKALAYSPDGTLLAVGGDDGILRVIESDTGKAVYTSPTRNCRIERVAFSPNGKLVVVGDTNANVGVYVPRGKGNQLALGVQGADSGPIAGVAFTADGAAVFSGGGDGKARLTAGPNPDGSGAPTTATRLRDYVGHVGPILGLAVTPDGEFLVTGGDDRTVRVWGVKSAKEVRSFQGHLKKVTAVAARGDGRQVASGSEDGAIRVWDLNATDDHRAVTDSKDSLWAVAVAPDGKRVAAAGADKRIRVYDPETGALEATLDAGAAMTALAFLPDGNRLVAAGGDKAVRVWDVAAKAVVRTLTGHTLAVLAVAASPDGKLVVSGSADSSVRGFDPESGKELWKWPTRKAACGVAVRAGGKQIAVGLADGTLAIVDVAGDAPKELSAQNAHNAGVACVCFSPDGSRLATVGGDGVLRVWSVGDAGVLTQLVKFETAGPPGAGGYTPLSAVAFSADSRFVAAGGADAVVRVWDVQTKSEVRGLRGHTDWVTSVGFTPNGRYLASVAAEKDNSLRIFELPALDTGGGSGGHQNAVNAVAVSPDGKQVATAGADQMIKLWDVKSGRELATLVGNADTPLALAFTGTDAVVLGGRVPTGDSGRLHFWGTGPARLNRSVVTGEVYTVVPAAAGPQIGVWAARPAVGEKEKNHAYELYSAKGDLLLTVADKGRGVQAVAFTPDLAWALGGDKTGTLRIWDLGNKGERSGGDWPLFQLGFADLGVTPDKKYLVAADEGGTVKVAGIEKRTVVASGTPHKGGTQAVLVSPTGKTFVTVGKDREVKAWALTEFKDEKLTELRSWALPVAVNGLAYTPDGKSVVTGNADGTAYILELP